MAKAKETKTIDKVVRVQHAMRDGYRRAGVAHKKGRVDHPAGTFTQDQIDAMQADPAMNVTVDPKDAAPAEG